MPKLSFQYVTGKAGAETLLRFLERRFRYHNADMWARLIRGGHVTVNGIAVAPDFQLRTRHKILYERPPFREPAVDRRYTILFEDEHLLAVNKSGNMPTSPSGKYWDNCLVHIVQKDRALQRLHAVHRLDRETSGVNLLAKTRKAARILGQDFQTGKVEKTYLAILRGALPSAEVYVSAPLLEDRQGSVRIRQTISPRGRDARTRFELLARLPGASLARAVPLTGRTHQIRAHAHFLGYPVWGDKLYGCTDAEFLDWVQRERSEVHPRHLLHASALALWHPLTGHRLTIHAPAKGLMDEFLADAEPFAGNDKATVYTRRRESLDEA